MRPWRIAVLAGAVTTTVRLACLFVVDPMLHRTNFDEGAYFTTAANFARGRTLYRDVVAVHPPGLTYFLAPFTQISDAVAGFVAARVAVTVVAGLAVALVVRICLADLGVLPSLGAGLTMLGLPDVAVTDRSLVLEPFLAVFTLAAAWVWLRLPGDAERRRLDRAAWLTGALIGVGASCKLLALAALVPVAMTARRSRRVHDLARVAAGAAGAFSVVVAPVALAAPAEFLHQALWFQAARPPDGDGIEVIDRVRGIFVDPLQPAMSRNVVALVVVLAAVAVALLGGARERSTRFAAAWFGAILVSFLLAPVYYGQYNAHLGPAVAILAAAVLRHVGRRWSERASRALRPVELASTAVLGLAAVVAVGISVRLVAAEAILRLPENRSVAREVGRLEGCTFSFDSSWMILGGLVPDAAVVGPLAADSYVGMLVPAVVAGEQDRMFSGPTAQRAVRDAVARCPNVVVGDRGWRQLDRAHSWFRAHFHRIATTGDGPDIWRRNGT